MPDQKEATRIHGLMVELENKPCPPNEDPVTFAAWKKREMEPLLRAYEKATGTKIDPYNDKLKDAITRGHMSGRIKPGEAPTTDNL